MKKLLFLLLLIPLTTFAQYQFEFGYTFLDNAELNEVQPFMSKKMEIIETLK